MGRAAVAGAGVGKGGGHGQLVACAVIAADAGNGEVGEGGSACCLVEQAGDFAQSVADGNRANLWRNVLFQ